MVLILTCLQIHVSLFNSFICLLAFEGKFVRSNLSLPLEETGLYLTLFLYLPSKTCDVLIEIDLFTCFHMGIVI